MSVDPKQFLLLHVEKAVFFVMAGLLVLVIWIFPPWDISVDEKDKILGHVSDLKKYRISDEETPDPKADPFLQEITNRINTPWGPRNMPFGDDWVTDIPRPLPDNRRIFEDRVDGGGDPIAPPPHVVSPSAVYAVADKGQAVIVFVLDDAAQRRALGASEVLGYAENGLPFDHIEIYRVDEVTGEREEVTPKTKDWLPPGLPARYGAPIATEGGARLDGFGPAVYVWSQRRGGRASDAERELRERAASEREARDRENERNQRERDRMMRERAAREAEARRRRRANERKDPRRKPDLRKRPPRIIRRTGPKILVKRVAQEQTVPSLAEHAKLGRFYFVDKNVTPDRRFLYEVVIICQNPLFKKSKPLVEPLAYSEACRSKRELEVPSFTRWFFQSGTASGNIRYARCTVRRFVGGRKDINLEEIDRIIQKLVAGDEPTKTPKKGALPENIEGMWIEETFKVMPGEEIGGDKLVKLPGGKDPKLIEFGTKCFLVNLDEDFVVIEKPRWKTIKTKDGVKRIKVLSRHVSRKMRIQYLDPEGRLKTRVQQRIPALETATTTTVSR